VKSVLVSTSNELAQASTALEGAPSYFIDTEFDFAPGARRLALIQVSRGDDKAYLIDPLKLTALEPLGKVLGRPGVEWVLHAGKQDVELLTAALRLQAPPAIFDTQVAWGLLGPEYPVSLAYLLYRCLGLRSMKGEQAGDWLRRPLTPEQIEYAAEDVAHLPELRDTLGARLKEKGREAVCLAASAESCGDEMEPAVTLDDFRNAWQLDACGLAVLRHLIDTHNALPLEERAQALPTRVFLSIAKLIPESGEELSRIKGIPFTWAKRHGAALAARITRVAFDARKAEFSPLEPPPYATWPGILAEGKLRTAIATSCAALEAAPDLLFPNRVVAALLKDPDALRGWRRELVGDALRR
jgi:ribonuclease D